MPFERSRTSGLAPSLLARLALFVRSGGEVFQPWHGGDGPGASPFFPSSSLRPSPSLARKERETAPSRVSCCLARRREEKSGDDELPAHMRLAKIDAVEPEDLGETPADSSPGEPEEAFSASVLPCSCLEEPEARPTMLSRPASFSCEAAIPPELERLLAMPDESFTQMLLRKIRERGMSNAQCYRRAHIDRKLFSKILSDIHYRPGKQTALAFAFALELPLEETQELLHKAGLSLSHSSAFDLIVEYFLRCGNYDLFAVNQALYAYDQPLFAL